MNPFESLSGAIKRAAGRLATRLYPRSFNAYSDDLVGFVEREYDRRKRERAPYELQWWLNLAFIDGQQYVDIQPYRNELVETPRIAWWEQREVFNHIAPIVETRVARISKMQPKLAVRPASTEIKDISGAKICQRLLDYVDRERFTPEQKQSLYAWLESCGTVLVKTTWNPKAGRAIGQLHIEIEDENATPTEPNIEPLDETTANVGAMLTNTINQTQDQSTVVQAKSIGVRAATDELIYEGDIDNYVCPPFEIFPDSVSAENIEDCRSIIHAKAYPKEYVLEHWGVEVDATEPVTVYTVVPMQVPGGGLGYGLGGYKPASQTLDGYVLVKEYWEKPSMTYPKGRLIVVGGHKLLYYAEELPYAVGPDGKPDLPFVKYVSLWRPGCFWGRAVVERLIPIQRRINAVRNRAAEFLARAAIGNLVVEEGSVSNAAEIEENAGAPGFVFWIKKYTAHVPYYMQTGEMPASFTVEYQNLLNELTMISGVSETSRLSEAPAGVKSGVALGLIVEQDNTRLSHTVLNVEAAKVRQAKMWLRLYKQFATAPRVLKTVGPDLDVELLDWDATDITSDDVIVETSALLSDTPAQRRQMVFELIRAGLFNDPDTGRISRSVRAKIFELLQFGDWEFGNDMDDLHLRRAERENRDMLAGQQPTVRAYDNDELHLYSHIKFMLGDKFEEANLLSQGTLEALFDAHIKEHVALVMQKQQALATGPQIQMGGVK